MGKIRFNQRHEAVQRQQALLLYRERHSVVTQVSQISLIFGVGRQAYLDVRLERIYGVLVGKGLYHEIQPLVRHQLCHQNSAPIWLMSFLLNSSAVL